MSISVYNTQENDQGTPENLGIRFLVNEIFGPTIQGEGLRTGMPSVFVRLNGCNLRCCFIGGSICDTPYASHHPEKSKLTHIGDSIERISMILEKYPRINDIVITGGEPMLQQEELGLFIMEMDKYVKDILKRKQKIFWTIETNGTIELIDSILIKRVGLWSISPKLASSAHFLSDSPIPEPLQIAHNAHRINYDALRSYIRKYSGDLQLKFVWTGLGSDKKEIDTILDAILYPGEKKNRAENVQIMLMPAGCTRAQLDATRMSALRECIRTGWRFCDRLQIQLWNDKRAV